ncbi:hypothetical protein [Streptomyces arboris]|uniref:hypothetical protein n=1 Tax=Streptomyces arboris TaxID=2600619 RepID=UPI003C2C0FCC
MYAKINETEWMPGHAKGMPDHETVIRIPALMIPTRKKACDAAERAGLHRSAEER